MPRPIDSWIALFGFVAVLGGSTSATVAARGVDACALLTPADIHTAAGISVAKGQAGKAIPGVLGRCTWLGTGNTKVILTLADAAHMQLTIQAQQQSGGTPLQGLGSKAVGVKGADFTGGGYIVSVVDAKGGFGVSILGTDGTQARAVALATLVERRR